MLCCHIAEFNSTDGSGLFNGSTALT